MTRPLSTIVRQVDISAQLAAITFILPIRIDQLEVSAVIDSAAQATVISSRVVQKMERTVRYTEGVKLKGIADGLIPGKLIKACPLTIGTGTYCWNVYEADIEDELLLGLDFMHHFGCKIDFRKTTFEVDQQKLPCRLIRRGPIGSQGVIRTVHMAKRIIIPPGTSKVFVESLMERRTAIGSSAPFFETRGF